MAERIRAAALHHKICPECGAAFTTDRPQVVTCTLRCNTTHNHRRADSAEQTEPTA
jgi:hypothetical protein